MSRYTKDDFFASDVRKAFVDREAKLRSSDKWPLGGWYNDDEFCELWRVSVTEIDKQAAEIKRLKNILKELRVDGHVYGMRPCPTCGLITKMLKEPFGCNLVQDRIRRSKGG